jgi:hypothetical protein
MERSFLATGSFLPELAGHTPWRGQRRVAAEAPLCRAAACPIDGEL